MSQGDNSTHKNEELKEKQPELKVSGSETNVEPREESLPDLGTRFELLGKIGEGGMGSVYKAREIKTDQIFAIKVLKDDLAKDAAALKRFEQEAEAARNLDHANLAAVYELEEHANGTTYLVMEYVEGRSLDEILKEKERLDGKKALEIFSLVTEALAYAHEKGVIHRDVKPTNIIITDENSGNPGVKVVDFGIAKVMPAANRETHNLTKTGDVFGSPNYMSPEQCLGFMLDQRSDIYSLGATIYETLAGKTPFEGDNPIQVVMKQVNEEAPPLPSDLKADKTVERLENVILRCLEKDPELRFQNVQEVSKDLALIREEKSPPRYVKRRKEKPKFTGFQTAAFTMGGFILLVFTIIGLTTTNTVPPGQWFVWTVFLFSGAGSFIFFHLTHERLNTMEGTTIKQGSAWLGLVTLFLGMACLPLVPPSLLAILGLEKNISFDLVSALIVTISSISFICALIAGMGWLIFKRNSRLGIPYLVSKFFILAIMLVSSTYFFLPDQSSRALGSWGKTIEKGLPDLAILLMEQAVKNENALGDENSNKYSDSLVRLYLNKKEFNKAVLRQIRHRDVANPDSKTVQELIDSSKKISDTPTIDSESQYRTRAAAYAKLGMYTESKDDLKIARSIDGSAPKNYALLAFVMKQELPTIVPRNDEEKIDGCIEVMCFALSKAKNNQTDYLILSNILAKDLPRTKAHPQKDNANLIEALEKVKEKPQGLRELYTAKIYELLGDRNKAAEQLAIAEKAGFNPDILGQEIEKNTGIGSQFFNPGFNL